MKLPVGRKVFVVVGPLVVAVVTGTGRAVVLLVHLPSAVTSLMTS